MTSNQIHHKWKNIEHKQSQLSKGITKDPHELGSKKMGKIQKSQSGQQIILRKPTHDNTWIYQLKQVRIRTIPQQTKQGQSKKSKQTHNKHTQKKKINKTTTQIFTKMKFKTRDMRWGNENSYLFLEDLEVKKCRNGVCWEWHGVFRWVSVKRGMGKTMNSHKKSREKLKKF